MKVIDHLEDFEKPDHSVVTIGTFDGVHIGHQAILKKIVDEAREKKGKSILITFWPHPRFILNKGEDQMKLLTTFDEKVSLIGDLGVDYILKIAFTSEFSNLSAEDFVRKILVDKVSTRKLYIGYDHHFGNNREGNIDFLVKRSTKYDFEVEEIPRQDIDDIGVSSTKIRNALNDGQVQLANALLGRNYTVAGKVIHGQKHGRAIGFPTANIEVGESYKLLPMDGSYAVLVTFVNEKYKAMLNIGFKPTLNGSKRTVEAHLFNFGKDIYGELLTVEFVSALRKEIKFDSLDELKKQLELDKQQALTILR